MPKHPTTDIAAGFVRPCLSNAVADHLREVINRPGFGENLPGEREIEARLQVSRGIVREALARMEADGLISRRHGHRTRILTEPLKTGGKTARPLRCPP